VQVIALGSQDENVKSSDRRRSLLGVCLTAALGVSCGSPDGDSGDGESTEQARQEIIGGTLTRARPEVGHYLPIGCGGTLIASDFFITASHCLFYENQRPDGTFRITMTDGRRLDFPIRNTYSLGYSPGPHDVAVGQLADPVPTWVAMPARIETNVGPSPLVTQIGFGCTAWGREDHGEKRYITQQWRATSVGCPGDSGGPVFTGALADNGGLFAIASGVNERTVLVVRIERAPRRMVSQSPRC
jgi:hypothetical protein